ncbi:TolC family protein (plasmid) [Pantoea sp. JZ29]|uniref:TolC family protein n=1 Tax=Pantoea sp. JZ29 TaxID=2654192 RepID=UPI002B46F245|nr:TolC family protein [Pantoea sp. JZ29]WRH23337.1 TolC family protein [Pantoea sp. JZ29]
MKRILLLALCLVALLCAGCTNRLTSQYRMPVLDYPVGWNRVQTNEDPAPFDWKAFNDPRLENWLHKVLANNDDVGLAVLRVYRAKLEAERIGVVSSPGLTATLSVNGTKNLDGATELEKRSSSSLSTLYELDLWGKIARQKDAALWATQATEADLRAARLTLLSEASKNYWRIGLISQQISSLQQSITYAKETLRLATARYNAGAASLLDVVDARQSLLSQQNRFTGLQNELSTTLNQKAVLTGTAPDSNEVVPKNLPQGDLPQIRNNIPASVLMNRPDVAAREWRVREALATVDVRRAEYYPAVNLTGSLGGSSSSLLSFLQNPVGVTGATLTLPFLEWRQRGLDVKIARNDYEQRLIEFKQLLYIAMSSIEDALSQHSQLLAQQSMLREGLVLARQSERINEVRYRQGAVRISFWLDAQEKRRQTELLLDENRFNQLQNLAKIYLEFGGSPDFP